MPSKIFSRILLFVPVFLALACSTFTPEPAPSDADIEREELAVFAFFAGEGTGPTLILQNTSTGMMELEPKELQENILSSFKDVSRQTVESYIARNEQPGTLSPDMELGVEYILLDSDELHEITTRPNWHEILAEKYPGSHGYLIFSHAGFNNSLDQAVVYVGQVAGPMMGSGSYYLMEKTDGEWTIVDQVMVWIS